MVKVIHWKLLVSLSSCLQCELPGASPWLGFITKLSAEWAGARPFILLCVPSKQQGCAFRLQKSWWPAHLMQWFFLPWHFLIGIYYCHNQIMCVLWPNYPLYKGPLIMSLDPTVLSSSNPPPPPILHGTCGNYSWIMCRVTALYTQEILKNIKELLCKQTK